MEFKILLFHPPQTKQYKSRNIFVRIIVSVQVEQKQAHKYILLYRPQEKLNIWKMIVSSSQFINKILILENNNFSQQFQKQKRPSLAVMMLSYYTAQYTMTWKTLNITECCKIIF
ncbi:Hypothetical_protein [Hexamita inflata]|uniref:Hypothetical_protein n=1 Tax=Hexamita inflata TaxID=28002 RepID=A0AA86UHT0_9EUKA|nr:Hypothetical protein HINF_LOCUS46365 [Hexamita inflata]